MKYTNLRREAIKEIERHCPLQDIKTKNGLVAKLDNYNKQYQGTIDQQRAKFIKYLINRMNKEIADQLHSISLIEQAEKFTGPLIITVEWKHSQMWGSNPTTFTNYGFRGKSIGGCGYCKLSTATAQALNNHYPLMAILYKIKNRPCNINKKNHELFKYGSGYYLLPRFEGGVGVESHQATIESLGLKWQVITNTPRTDVFMITK